MKLNNGPRQVQLGWKSVASFAAALVLMVFGGLTVLVGPASATSSSGPVITNITASCTGTGTITVTNPVEGATIVLKLTYHVPADSVFHDTSPLQTTTVTLHAGQTSYPYTINVTDGYPDTANTLRVEVASTTGADFGSSVNTKSPSFGPCGATSSTTSSSSSTSSTSSTSSSSSTTSTAKLGLDLSVVGCIGGETSGLINGEISNMVDGVNYSVAGVNPDGDAVPTPGLVDNTFSIVADVPGVYHVTVTGDNETSASASAEVKVCTSTSTTSTTSSSSTSSSSTTSTGTKTTSTGHPSTSHPSKTTKPAPSTTTKHSYPVAAHTGGSGDNNSNQMRLGLAAIAASLLILAWMSRGVIVATIRPTRRY
ncbi:MAG: hypothetical protein ABIR37_00855 [Candidatus Saccharimonadales bacterium]